MLQRILYTVYCISLLVAFTGCKGQEKNMPAINTVADTGKPVGGGCDGCELMFVGMPATISSADTSAGWAEEGQQLIITGKVFHLDGKTPAPGVILYYWQTDNDGLYSPRSSMPAAARRHGHIRGWVQTDSNGCYSICTIRPAAYPRNSEPAHIHISVKEPGIGNEYYIDEFVFDDDPLLNTAKRKAMQNRGGSGVLRVLISEDIQIAEHNIILGLHIPHYPDKENNSIPSGLHIGEDNPSFTPYHAYGPDKGTKTCPVCKYGRYHGILYFVGNKPNWDDIKKWLVFLEYESNVRKKYLKVYFVYGNENNYNRTARVKEFERLGTELALKNIALTFVPSFNDIRSNVYLNRINPDTENTFILYRQSTIIDKHININATPDNFRLILNTLDKIGSDYFHLPVPVYD